jgi:hypothetical protein
VSADAAGRLPDWDFDGGDEFDKMIDAQHDWDTWTVDQELRLMQWMQEHPHDSDLETLTREEAAIFGDEQ